MLGHGRKKLVLPQLAIVPTSLDVRDKELLKAISQSGGFLPGEAAFNAWRVVDRRAGAREATSRFRAMEKMGLVKMLDDQKPVCWMRTDAGTAAISG